MGFGFRLELRGSQGTTQNVTESYSFKSGFGADSACRNAADAYPRAVQNLVAKALSSPVFLAKR